MELKEIKGIGDKTLKKITDLNIKDISDLVGYFPVEYRDLSEISLLAEHPKNESLFRLRLTSGPSFFRRSGGKSVMSYSAKDTSGSIRLTFFNQTYVSSRLKKDGSYLFWGRISLYNGRPVIYNPKVYDESSLGKLEPVYLLKGGIKQQSFRNIVSQALSGYFQADYLSKEFREMHGLLELVDETSELHFPESKDMLSKALRSHKLREMMLFCTMVNGLGSRSGNAPRIKRTADITNEFNSLIGFKLNDSQLKCIDEILIDMDSSVPMNRLLQGDVGSGKTAVAFYAAYVASKKGFQTIFVVPTEILAYQHYSNAERIFGKRAAVLTGSSNAEQRRRVHEGISNGSISILIATHAVLYADLNILNPGLAIIDEQHRFGVAQRAAVSMLGPMHTLVMSATPIPRTLALTYLRKIKTSVIDTLPEGRKSIKTFIVPASKRKDMYDWIHESIIRERSQAYVVTPLVEPSDEIEAQSLSEVYKELTASYSDIRTDYVYGTMPSDKKKSAMEFFSSGKTGILAATTVIEVGVDVPNANIIVIENAERFGLSDLHQLRGRVGRGNRQSYCYLVSEDTDNVRLKTLASTQNGFEIAEADLSIRGEGEFLGQKQHGLPSENIFTETEILNEAMDAIDSLHEDSDDMRNLLKMAELTGKRNQIVMN